MAKNEVKGVVMVVLFGVGALCLRGAGVMYKRNQLTPAEVEVLRAPRGGATAEARFNGRTMPASVHRSVRKNLEPGERFKAICDTEPVIGSSALCYPPDEAGDPTLPAIVGGLCVAGAVGLFFL